MRTWFLTHDLDHFLRRARHFLHAEPALHTALLSVTDTLRVRGLHVYGEGDPLFGIWVDADADADDVGSPVRGAFLRTPPHHIALSPLDEPAADALAARLHAAGHALPGVMGDRDTADAFADAWKRYAGTGTGTGAGVEVSLDVRQRLYRLGELTPPEPTPPGHPRVAGKGDRELLIRWHQEFGAAIGERAHMEAGEWADARIAYGGVTLWESQDGTPLAMAGNTRRTAGQVRVAPVYTPAELRGRGYAGAVVAEVSRAARADEVLLFTDLDNPTSNGLYQRIGYRPVRDFAVYSFTATAAR
ncbi:GNAT family N-acetyltransferase [Streptomyces sp. NPDC059009]|uniref:GNAT family N-acetyltransferase n=1 Tax=Streptomyces sp. NPDC059009 TaxID=3346694 RepID=UPI0036BC674D